MPLLGVAVLLAGVLVVALVLTKSESVHRAVCPTY